MFYLGFFDPTYYLVIICVIISLIATINVKSVISRYSRVSARCGLTGAEVASRILDSKGLYDVTVERNSGSMTDHYDPSSKVLRLSDTTYDKKSISAISIAAHECGHAIQDAEDYTPLSVRSTLVPVANIGSYAAWVFIALGAFLTGNQTLITIGILCFSVAVLFQLVTLPVEFNASRRALAEIQNLGIVYDDEHKQAKKVLKAAALTYVAAALTAVIQLLRLILLFGGRNRD